MLEGDKIELNHLYLYKSYNKSIEYFNINKNESNIKSNAYSNERNINKYSKVKSSYENNRCPDTSKKKCSKH